MEALCTPAEQKAGVAICKKNWCTRAKGPAKRAICQSDITVHTWAKTYCALFYAQAQDPRNCNAGDCMKCVNHIRDFGWDFAVALYGQGNLYNSGTSGGGDCISNSAQLPPDLLTCQRGIRIQYLVSPGVWQTVKAIPHGTQICNDHLSFDSDLYPELFRDTMRFSQCSLPDTCPTSEICVPEPGFKVTVDFSKDVSEFCDGCLDTMVDSGIVICNPAQFPNNPKGCI
jgi:hypothetical protein